MILPFQILKRKPNFAGLIAPITNIEIEKRTFQTKLEFARYIDGKLSEMIESNKRMRGSNDFWNVGMVVYFYWEQVAPESNGKGKLENLIGIYPMMITDMSLDIY